jgi:hypothetical protein
MRTELWSPLMPYGPKFGPKVFDAGNVAVRGPRAVFRILAGADSSDRCIDMPFGKGDNSSFIGKTGLARVRDSMFDDFRVANGRV